MHLIPSCACCDAIVQVPARWSCRPAAVQHLCRSSSNLHQCTGSRSTFELGLTPRPARRRLRGMLCRVALQVWSFGSQTDCQLSCLLSIRCSCRQPIPQSKMAQSVSSCWQGVSASAWGSVSLPTTSASCCLLAMLRLKHGNYCPAGQHTQAVPGAHGAAHCSVQPPDLYGHARGWGSCHCLRP